jgi:HEAT repeat protein
MRILAELVRRAALPHLVGGGLVVAVVGLVKVSMTSAELVAMAICDLTTHREASARVAAAVSLGRSKRDSGAREVLEISLHDASAEVRSAVASSLGALGDPAAVAALRVALDRETAPEVRYAIESAISKLATSL